MDNQELLTRIDRLMARGQELLEQQQGDVQKYVPEGEFTGWRARVLNFLVEEAGEKNTYTKDFSERVNWATSTKSNRE
jgi:hypothetical protein